MLIGLVHCTREEKATQAAFRHPRFFFLTRSVKRPIFTRIGGSGHHEIGTWTVMTDTTRLATKLLKTRKEARLRAVHPVRSAVSNGLFPHTPNQLAGCLLLFGERITTSADMARQLGVKRSILQATLRRLEIMGLATRKEQWSATGKHCMWYLRCARRWRTEILPAVGRHLAGLLSGADGETLLLQARAILTKNARPVKKVRNTNAT
jgi:hypothetical protein